MGEHWQKRADPALDLGHLQDPNGKVIVKGVYEGRSQLAWAEPSALKSLVLQDSSGLSKFSVLVSLFLTQSL